MQSCRQSGCCDVVELCSRLCVTWTCKGCQCNVQQFCHINLSLRCSSLVGAASALGLSVPLSPTTQFRTMGYIRCLLPLLHALDVCGLLQEPALPLGEPAEETAGGAGCASCAGSSPAVLSSAGLPPAGLAGASAAPAAGLPAASSAGLATPPARLISYLEVFAGERAVSRAMAMFGYDGRSMDLRHSDPHNFLSPAGFLTVISTVMSMHQHAVIWLAPPCSTWVWVSRHSTGRDMDVMGNAESRYVASQNALVARMVFVLVLAIKRNVYFIIEQPTSTLMFEHPAMKQFLARFSSMVSRVELHMGSFNLKSQKDTILLGTAPYLSEMGRKMTPAEREAMSSSADCIQTTKIYVDARGQKRCSGTAQLKGTQAYPLQFGALHALAFKKSLHAHTVNKIAGPPLNPDDSEEEDPDVECLQDIFDNNPGLWDSNKMREEKLKLKRK